jgi:REP element-mobilizing transposase RayT
VRRGSRRRRQGDLFAKAEKPHRNKDGSKPKKRGRKPNGARAGESHLKRSELKPRFPIHVVLRVSGAVGSLRTRFMYRALREATIAVALRELAYDDMNGAFRIVHVSIQRTHVHLLVEADNRRAMSAGMRSFQISAAKHINREYSVKLGLRERRRGVVFPDRYHEEVIETPRQARRALAYVLNNWRKHREDQAEHTATWKVDPFSSGFQFLGWKEREEAEVFWKGPDRYDPLVVYFPKTWLLSKGWLKHGRISFHEVPGPKSLAA